MKTMVITKTNQSIDAISNLLHMNLPSADIKIYDSENADSPGEDGLIVVFGKDLEGPSATPGVIFLGKDFYLDGKLINFRRKKTRELMRCLIKHKGTIVDDDALLDELFGVRSENKKSYLRVLKADLVNTLEEMSDKPMVVKMHGRIGLM